MNDVINTQMTLGGERLPTPVLRDTLVVMNTGILNSHSGYPNVVLPRKQERHGGGGARMKGGSGGWRWGKVWRQAKHNT